MADDAARLMLARLLSAGREGYAATAARTLIARHPDAARAFAAGAQRGWHGYLAGRLAELATAVATDRPALLAEQLRWAEIAFGARGLQVEDIHAALDTLREVLAEELPPPHAALADQVFGEALEALEQIAIDAPLTPEDDESRLALAYLVALREGKRREAWKLVLDAVAGGMTIPRAYSGVLMRAMHEVGRLWANGELLVAEEHMVTVATQQLLPQLYPYADYQPLHGKTVLVSSVGGNVHDLALRLLADLLEQDGWRVVLLGADFPDEDLGPAVEHFGADLVALSIALVPQIDSLTRIVGQLREHDPRPPIIAGGHALSRQPDLATQLGADATASDILSVPPLARSLAGLPPTTG